MNDTEHSMSDHGILTFRRGRVVNEALTGLAAELDEVIGTDALIDLLTKRGGTTLFIPMSATDSVLAELIGESAAEQLIDFYGTGPLLLPCAHLRGAGGRRARAARMLRNGASLSETAMACDISSRSATNYRRALRDAGLLPPNAPEGEPTKETPK